LLALLQLVLLLILLLRFVLRLLLVLGFSALREQGAEAGQIFLNLLLALLGGLVVLVEFLGHLEAGRGFFQVSDGVFGRFRLFLCALLLLLLARATSSGGSSFSSASILGGRVGFSGLMARASW